MKILYNQNKNQTSALSISGIEQCYLKYITDSSTRISSKKLHHHTFYEVHIIHSGVQVYDILGKEYEITDGQLLFIQPHIPHRLVSSSNGIEKYAICFRTQTETQLPFFTKKFSRTFLKDLATLKDESKKKTDFSRYITECTLCKTIITLLRNAKCKEYSNEQKESENTILSLAKQYIKDNIECSPTVCEVANYCSISERQLTRLFIAHESINAKQFITEVKTKKIAEFILDENLSLQEISKRMGFSNEYYFNSFFKKHFGLPPANYRKMHGK